MKQKILNLKKNKSLYEIALDMEISESTLYNYINDYKKISQKSIDRIRNYFKERESKDESTINKTADKFQRK